MMFSVRTELRGECVVLAEISIMRAGGKGGVSGMGSEVLKKRDERRMAHKKKKKIRVSVKEEKERLKKIIIKKEKRR